MNFLHEFFKEQPKQILLSNVRIKTKAKDLKVNRNSFTAITRGTLTLNSSNGTSSSIEKSSSSCSGVQLSSNGEGSSQQNSETIEKTSNKPKSSAKEKSSNKPKSSSSNEALANDCTEVPESFANSAFLKHYKELVEENERIKKELARHKKAVRHMNEMIKQMVNCLDDYQDIFELGDSVITYNDKTIILTHKERSKICELGEKTSQILHVSTTYFQKPITSLNQDERKLLFRIIFDAMGLKISNHQMKLRKYQAVFRTIACKLNNTERKGNDESVKKKKKTESKVASSKKRKEREERSDSNSSSSEEEEIDERNLSDDDEPQMSDEDC